MVDTDDNLYIVLELAQGGDLFDRVSGKERFTETETQFVFYQLLEAVQYLQRRVNGGEEQSLIEDRSDTRFFFTYSQGVAHRDLKLENILLGSTSDDALVKITDFGLAKLIGPQSFMKTMCGTPSYQAPEVLLAGNGQAAPEAVRVKKTAHGNRCG